MQGTPFHVGGHPLRILRPTQGVFVQKLFGTGNAHSIETAAAPGVAIYIERSAYFAWLKIAYASHGKTEKVEPKFFVGN